MKNEVMKESLSAIIDGEFEKGEFEQVLHRFASHSLVQTASLYFHIGDVLRERDAFLALSSGFTDALHARLKSETYLSVDLDDAESVDGKKSVIFDI